MDVSYAKSIDGTHVAYATLGDGPPDLLILWAAMSHVRLDYEEPLVRRFYDDLATSCRVVAYDERGFGMSDPIASSETPTYEQRAEDVLAVMDSLGIERASLFGWVDGGPLALYVAATYPERVDRLVLFCSYARLTRDDDYPIGIDPSVVEWSVDHMKKPGVDRHRPLAPSADDAFLERYDRLMEDSGGSPAREEHQVRRAGASDVRAILSSVSAPTLVLHRSDSLVVPVALGRYLAEHLPHATFVEVPGPDTIVFVGDIEPVIDHIEEFLTGQRSSSRSERMLTTVLFTDIVDSTKQASDLGDHRWRQLLDDHDGMVRRQFERFRGRAIKHTGDGFLGSFDGPARAIHCACAIRDGAGLLGMSIRAGLHTGECEARGDDLSGIAVHIGARVQALAGPGEVFVSSAIPPLVTGSGIEFSERGVYQLKGVPGDWQIFAVDL
jgi:pimeloyl-ACP methyl ester carboxylesterase/class 3 adenylate cyclase